MRARDGDSGFALVPAPLALLDIMVRVSEQGQGIKVVKSTSKRKISQTGKHEWKVSVRGAVSSRATSPTCLYCFIQEERAREWKLAFGSFPSLALLDIMVRVGSQYQEGETHFRYLIPSECYRNRQEITMQVRARDNDSGFALALAARAA